MIGLKSGTFLDGSDAANPTTDGRRLLSFGPAVTRAHPLPFRGRLRGLLGKEPDVGAAGIVREPTMLAKAHGVPVESVGAVGVTGIGWKRGRSRFSRCVQFSAWR